MRGEMVNRVVAAMWTYYIKGIDEDGEIWQIYRRDTDELADPKCYRQAFARDKCDEMNARAAIATLREPTPAMLAEARRGWAETFPAISAEELAVTHWQAMIDQALKP